MKRTGLVYSLLLALLAVFILINISMGSTSVDLSRIFDIILNHDLSDTAGVIIWEIRLPRIVAAVFLGGALALSGYLLQTFFSNPIAGPYVLGISSGAKLLVAFLMVISLKSGFSLKAWMMILSAFVGSLIATGIVLMVSKKVRNVATLIVCGVMIGYICSAATELIVTFADDSNIVNLHNWSLGTFSSSSWKEVAYIVPIVIVGLVFTFFMSKQTEAYSYGENYAISLGINVRLFRFFLILCSSVLSATVTAFAGPVSFVGIAVPHVIRVILKSEKPKLLVPAIFLAGAVFCLISDLLARSLFAPRELSISTITAIFGAPVVVAMLLKKKRG